MIFILGQEKLMTTDQVHFLTASSTDWPPPPGHFLTCPCHCHCHCPSYRTQTFQVTQWHRPNETELKWQHKADIVHASTSRNLCSSHSYPCNTVLQLLDILESIDSVTPLSRFLDLLSPPLLTFPPPSVLFPSPPLLRFPLPLCSVSLSPSALFPSPPLLRFHLPLSYVSLSPLLRFPLPLCYVSLSPSAPFPSPPLLHFPLPFCYVSLSPSAPFPSPSLLRFPLPFCYVSLSPSATFPSPLCYVSLSPLLRFPLRFCSVSLSPSAPFPSPPLLRFPILLTLAPLYSGSHTISLT